MAYDRTMTESAQSGSQPQRQIGRWCVRGCFVIGLLSLGYCLYDLARPGHFVGDMYGMEVMFRLILLVPAGGVLLVGLVLSELRRTRQFSVVNLLGNLLVIPMAIALAVMAANVMGSRHQDAVRATYPSLDTAELLRIAREEKDQFAIYALFGRKDAAAMTGLRDILFDASEHGNLRNAAAHALGEIGTDEARAALEEARQTIQDPNLRIAIDYALHTRMGSDIADVERASPQPQADMPTTADSPDR